MDSHLADNLASWDERAPAHAASEGYCVERMVADPAYLSEVVRFDLPRLGSVEGLRGVHLQCHIGTDTISLSRLGARMTGLDFSGEAVRMAREIAERCAADVDFVQARVDHAFDVLPRESFDLLFTGIGALCWLDDIDMWADVVTGLLVPGGRLFLREGHPMLWAIDERRDDGLLVVDLPYRQTIEPVTDESDGSYVDTGTTFTATRSHCWNHGLGEVVSALLSRGMRLTMLVEHESVPWQALPQGMRLRADGEWVLEDRPERLPLTYTLQAVKD